MVEIVVADWAASLAWYRDRIGLAVVLLDEPNRFALLAAPPARLSMTQGVPTPGTTRIIFQVADLEAELERLSQHGVAAIGTVIESTEGYRRAILVDPDGHAIHLIDWTTGRRISEADSSITWESPKS